MCDLELLPQESHIVLDGFVRHRFECLNRRDGSDKRTTVEAPHETNEGRDHVRWPVRLRLLPQNTTLCVSFFGVRFEHIDYCLGLLKDWLSLFEIWA